MNKLLHIVFVSALLAVIYSEVGARSYISLPRGGKAHLRIVNGTTAADGEFPYAVQLRDKNRIFLCGGGIIGEKWILTAGHCVENEIESIVYGRNDLDEHGDTPNVIKVKQMYQHPKFAYNDTDIGSIPLYDVGILELAEAIPFSTKAQPIKLANSSENVPFGADGVLAGWGVNETLAYDAQPYLQKILLKVLNDTECVRKNADAAGEDIFKSVHFICSEDYLEGPCYGDSGSPFVINGIQFGFVSWSIPPCGRNPAAYSRITNPEYRDFIRNVTGI